MDAKVDKAGGCPVMHGAVTEIGSSVMDWWPNALNLDILHQHDTKTNPMGKDFDYREEVKKLDVEALKKDMHALMTDSQDWWPADWGHYGGLMIRMAWHAAGSYRLADGRGGGGTGNQRFAPLNSWPDNVSLDKARRLLWPIKKKYGNKVSWADLIILAGNIAYESMGLKTFGFGFGREDIWHPEKDTYWGAEKEWLAPSDGRYDDVDDPDDHGKPAGRRADGPDLRQPGRRERQARPAEDRGPGARDLRPHGDERRGNRGADRRRPHRRQDPRQRRRRRARSGAGSRRRRRCRASAGPIPNMDGKAANAVTSGLEGAWTTHPTQFDMGYFDMLFGHEWELKKSPAGANQWEPVDIKEEDKPVDAERSLDPPQPDDDRRRHGDEDGPGLQRDLREVHGRSGVLQGHLRPRLVQADPPRHGPEGALHRSGRAGRRPDLAGPDPGRPDRLRRRRASRPKIAASGLSIAEMVSTAWDSARTYPRLRHARRRQRRPHPPGPAEGLGRQRAGASGQGARRCSSRSPTEAGASIADVIVLAGNVGIEQAAKAAGYDVSVPFAPGRGDATDEMTDADSFDVAGAARRRLPQLAEEGLRRQRRKS